MLKEAEKINELLFPLKSSENCKFSNDGFLMILVEIEL